MSMAQEDIVKMARKAGIAKYGLGWTCWEGQLEAFAALVAAAEREACAKVCAGEVTGEVTGEVKNPPTCDQGVLL